MAAIPTMATLCGSRAQCNPLFLRLVLTIANTSTPVSTNDYWLSTVPDVMNWNASNFYRTPLSSYANYTDLCRLPPVAVSSTILSSTLTHGPGSSTPRRAPLSPSPHAFDPADMASMTQLTVNVTNASPAGVAFLVRLRIRSTAVAATDKDVLPVLWDDNYLTLRPMEVTFW